MGEIPSMEFDLPHFSGNGRRCTVVTGRAAWRRTEGEAGVGEGTIGGAVAARVSDERKRGVSGAVPTAAGFPSSEIGRDSRCLTAIGV